MRYIRTCLFALTAALLVASTCAGQQGRTRGWWPQDYSLQRDDSAGKLTVSTRYYVFEHDLKRGGTIQRIRLTQGRAENLLARPIATTVQLASEPGKLANEREAPTKLTFSDLNDGSPSVTQDQSGGAANVVVEAALRDEAGRDSGVRTRTVYSYHWGYLKIHKELLFGDKPVRARHVSVFSTILDPSLSDYGYRPGIRELMDPDLFSWRHGQIREWGKIRPGTHFDLPLRTRQAPRYVVFANQGVEGIEWFMSDDLRQWDYQMTGEPGTGYFEASASTSPLGVEVSINPLMLSSRYELPKGGAAPLQGTYAFDYYVGVPILEGHAHNPWLNKSYAVNKGEWVSEEQIRRNKEDGITTMHLHNDGDAHRDGLFWRDGSYPPYPAEEMKKMDATIAAIHKYGLKTAPYFSHHELHQSTEAFKKHGEEWGRIVDDQGNLRPNFFYGAHMCLKSGWLDFLKLSIDRVLNNHKFDGVYYDWNIAMFCNNPRHVGKSSNGVPADKGLGAVAISETAHWDMEELLGLVEWTRQRVGPDGIVILHNTLVPMFATENFANYVVGMEFSYGLLSTGMPRPSELPLEWNFAGARPRTVIGYGTIAKEAPPRLHRLHAITTLMTSVAPWPASDEAIELYKMLKPLGDLEQYQFEDYRNAAVSADSRDCISAVYSKPGEAYVLLANLAAEAAAVRCRIQGQKLRNPLPAVQKAEVMRDGKWVALDGGRLAGAGESIQMPGDSVALIRLR